jgi:hypothetical protein
LSTTTRGFVSRVACAAAPCVAETSSVVDVTIEAAMIKNLRMVSPL